MQWKTINGKKAPKIQPQVDVLFKGMLNKETLLDLIRHFIVFEVDKDKKDGRIKIAKKLAAYHQYNAVNKAVESTIKATKKDRRAGVIWHTQGSGKSLIMVFYTGKLVLQPELENPTIILLTDRNDLDDQLFGTFSRCHDLLRQEPKQAESREEIKELLKVSSGGIIFTTIQKFLPETKGKKYPLLSDRRNIIVIADEAHRSHYGELNKILVKLFESAFYVAFTGTPKLSKDKSTFLKFGEPIDIYFIDEAEADKFILPVYYKANYDIIKLTLEKFAKNRKNYEELMEKILKGFSIRTSGSSRMTLLRLKLN